MTSRVLADTRAAFKKDGNLPAQETGIARHPLMVCTALFLATAVFKIFYFSGISIGPIIFGDEKLYRDFAKGLFELRGYANGQYPPLYPLLISPSFFFDARYYDAAIVLNCLYSSSVVFPAFLIARLFMDTRNSILCAVFALTVPFQFFFPRALMSENIFLPILLWSFYLCVRKPNDKVLIWDALTAVSLAALYLTRHISLAIIPALLSLWAITNYQRDRRFFYRLLYVVAITCIAYAPWLVMGLSKGVALNKLLGFGIASRSNPEQKTLARLGFWLFIYYGYFVVITAPVFHLLWAGVIQIVRNVTLENIYKNRLVIGSFLITFAGIAAATRHSWNVYYNFPSPMRMMGRYIMFAPIFFFMSAFYIANSSIYAISNISNKVFFFIFAISIATIILFYTVFYESLIVPIHQTFFGVRIAIDGYKILFHPELWLIAVIAIVSITTKMLWDRKSGVTLVIFLGFVFINLWGIKSYEEDLSASRVYSVPSRALYDLSSEQGKVRKFKFFITDSEAIDPNGFKERFRFWGLPGEILPLSDLKTGGKSGASYALVPADERTNYPQAEEILRYPAIGTTFALLKLP